MNEANALLSLMQSKYAEIREIETFYQIMGRDGDYRARIEYYHDAVRALGSDYDDGLSRDSRLSVERLAYDAEMLRLITARPLHAGRGEQHFSTSDAVSMSGMAGTEHRPDPATKQALAKAYKDYTVYFVALLAEKADMNSTARLDEMDLLVEDCHILEKLLLQLANGTADIADVIRAASMIEHEGLRRHILTFLNKGRPNKGEINSASATVQNARLQFDAEHKAIDAAGLRFAGSQLAVYEESKDVVKALAGQGLNIAGKFTANAMQHQTDKGRGI
jgi:hypothetical protein